MRAILSVVTLFVLLSTSSAQIFDPVSWTFTSTHLDGDNYELTFKAKIDAGWAIYSQHIGEDGPIPTEFVFDEGAHYTTVGNVTESDNAKKSHDPVFDMQLTKFYKTATFTQKVKASDITKPIVGYLVFMTCDDERCLPPKDVEFSLKLEAANDKGKSSIEEEGSESEIADVGEIDFDMVGGNETIDGDVSPGLQSSQDGMFTPVTWSTSYEMISNDTYLLKITAVMDKGWTIYTQFIDTSKIGPIPTTFYFDDAEGQELIGDVEESGLERIEGMDRVFEMQLVKYKRRADFVQKIRITDINNKVTGELEYMACNDMRCLTPTFVEFAFDLTVPSSTAVLGPTGGLPEGISEESVIDQSVASIQTSYEDPVGQCQQEETVKNKSLLTTFIFGFLGGLLALLTPCVFPMIPLTVSFFSKDSKRKGWWNGVVYGASIIVIYVAIGLLITAVFGATALNKLSTDWIANTLFFLIFIFFAFSFFGFYEIQLPNKWANKSDRMADKGGYLGIFFMAATLAIVSFSCTGPIIGTAIVESATNAKGPFIVMLGFSTALALPFGLFAAFPAWLNTLPQSGSWMNSVKVILGFLELALAFKFLSVADMTSHWDFLRYELFLGIWVIVAIGMALYLFGLIKFPHDSPLKKLSPVRATLGVGLAALAVYMATGFMGNERTMTYNSLPMLSGLAPPAHYNFFKPAPDPDPAIKARFPSYSKCANNLDCFHDYTEGIAYANEVTKPIFLDFTGYGCVNCRKTEEHIWVRDEVWNRLKNDYVMISLYVDDRERLEEPLYSLTRDEKIRNIGSKWADFQIVNFQQNSQPLYVIISPDERVLATPRGYREGVQEYADFLECGLATFRNLDTRVGELR